MIAETKRLVLRRYNKDDLQDLFEYLSDKEVVEYEPYKPLTLNETKENLEWRIGTDEMIAVELKNSHKMIGNVYLGKREFEALELGYVFNRNYLGHVNPYQCVNLFNISCLCGSHWYGSVPFFI